MFFRNRFIALLTAALSGGGLSFALYHLFFRVFEVYLAGGGVRVWNTPLLPRAVWLGCLLLPLAAMLAPDRRKSLSRIAAAAAPWLLLWPLLLMPPGLSQLALMAVVTGWGAFRFGWLYGPALPEQRLSPRRTQLILLILWAGTALYGFWVQFQAHITLFFIYGDWSQYAEHYLALLSGKASFGAWLTGAGHFNPLVNLIMTAQLAVWRGPETVFAVNALLVSSAVPLAYLLTRRHGASAATGLALALAAALNPALSHQYLGFIYGFHPVAFMVPLILGFMILEKSRWKWLLFALSLGIQETAAVFWFGYGLYLLCRKQYRTGTVLLLAMPCWFFAAGHWIMPWAAGSTQYNQVFHYAALGNSLPEVALSPILRPRAFWGAVSQQQSLSFLLCVLVPLWFAAGRKWVWMIAALPLAAGVCMQDSADVKTIALQYSMELSVWLLAVSALAVPAGSVPRWWRTGLPAGNAAAGSIAGVLTATVLGWMLFGYAEPYGKYTTKWARFITDARPFLTQCTAGEPPQRVLAGSHIRNHFLFRYPTAGLDAEPQTGDLVVLLLHDRLFDADNIEKIRRKLFLRQDVMPIAADGCLAAFRVGVPGTRPVLPVMTDAEFESWGEEAETGDTHFRARVQCFPGKAVIRIRIENTPSYDVDLFVSDSGFRPPRVLRRAFAEGLLPAYGCPPGSVWTIELEMQNFCRLLLRERPGSAAAYQTIKDAK